MKKTMILALTIMLLATSAMGFAEAVPTTTNVEGVLNRSISFSDRNPDGSFPMNPEIDKESPTTGLPTENSEYLPILVQIDNNLGALAQWGIADADIMYEAPIQGGGWTRMTALFSDIYPEEAGPDRSARIMHADIREEWDAVFVHFGQQEAFGSDVREVLREYGVNKKGLNIDGIGNRYKAYFDRVKYHSAPHNVTVYVNKLRGYISSQLNYTFPTRPYLFTDKIEYTGPNAKKISVNHMGNSDTVSTFIYDEMSNGYQRYSKKGLYMDLLKPEEQLIYNNILIQRTPLTFNFSHMNPLLRDIVGQGAADIFIGGKYIAGAWARNSLKERTVFFDQNGKEIQLQRGKTWIMLADVDTAIRYDDVVDYRAVAAAEDTLPLPVAEVVAEQDSAEALRDNASYVVTDDTNATDTTRLEDLKYRIESGWAIITGYTGDDKTVTIPSKIDGYQVAAIDHAAFMNQAAIEKIILPEGLYSIGNNAFKNCQSAVSIDLPTTVRHIGSGAFENCYALTNVVVPEGIVELKGRAFLKNRSLQTITLPKSLQSIGTASLAGLEQLPELELPKGVKTIGMGAFAGNNALTHITLPNSVEEIGYSAFHGSASLKEVVLPVGIREVAGGMFYDCPQLEKVVVPVNARRLDTSMLFTNSPNVQVHSFANSAAQGVAKELKIPFVAVDPISQVDIKAGDRNVTGGVVAIDLSGEERTLPLIADVTPDSPWSELSWKSSSPKVATVDAYGVVTGHQSGVATITASTMDGSRVSASCKVNVAHLVHEVVVSGDANLMAADSTVLKAEAFPSEADDKEVVWSSSHPDIANVSKKGKVTAAKKVPAITQVTISAEARDGSGVIGKHVITITPIAYDIQLLSNGKETGKKDTLGIDLLSENTTMQLTAQVIPADASQSVTWKSSKPKVASVDENGLVTGHEKGTATITVATQDGSKVKGEYKVNVANLAKEVTIVGSNAVAAGRSIVLSATVLPENTDNKGVEWLSSDSDIATVGKDGKVIGRRSEAVRNVQITAIAKDGSGVQAVHQVSVHPIATDVTILKDNQKVEGKVNFVIDLTKGENTLQLGAAVLPQDAAQGVEWKSSSPAVLSVDENGLLTAHKNGKVTITAAATDGSRKRTTVTVVVISSIKEIVLSGDSSVKAGGWTRLKVTYTPADVSSKDLVWTSSDTTAATVTKEGVVNARKVKQETKVIITATSKDGSDVSASMEITVLP